MVPHIQPGDIPPDVADRLGRLMHRRECGSYDAYRLYPPARTYDGEHRRADMWCAAVRLAQTLEDLGVPLAEFDLIVDRRQWGP